MKTITIYLKDRGIKNNKLEVSGNVAAVNAASIKRVLEQNKKQINRWLLFGEATFDVMDNDTGEIVAQGNWMYNTFSGGGNYSFEVL